MVVTHLGIFFIAISAPLCSIDGQEYTCLSPQAPFYLAMKELQAGDWMDWSAPHTDEDEIEILAIY